MNTHLQSELVTLKVRRATLQDIKLEAVLARVSMVRWIDELVDKARRARINKNK